MPTSYDGYSHYRRKNPDETTAQVAERLKGLGILFEREKRIGKYYADFYLRKHRLIVEIDGGSWYSDQSTVRDDDFHSWHYAIIHFARSLGSAAIVQQIVAWISDNQHICQMCWQAPRVGKRYCPACSLENKNQYLAKIGLAEPMQEPKADPDPAKQFLLWPLCKLCDSTGWMQQRGKRFVRCSCRQQLPLRFGTQAERDQAERELWQAAQARNPITPQEHEQWRQLLLRFSRPAQSASGLTPLREIASRELAELA